MEDRKHSGLGIASFTTSIVSSVLIIFLFTIAGAMEASAPGGIDEESPEAVFLGLSILTFLFTSLVALGLGIGGLADRERKKIFATLGAIFSAATITGTIFLMILGLVMA